MTCNLLNYWWWLVLSLQYLDRGSLWCVLVGFAQTPLEFRRELVVTLLTNRLLIALVEFGFLVQFLVTDWTGEVVNAPSFVQGSEDWNKGDKHKRKVSIVYQCDKPDYKAESPPRILGKKYGQTWEKEIILYSANEMFWVYFDRFVQENNASVTHTSCRLIDF